MKVYLLLFSLLTACSFMPKEQPNKHDLGSAKVLVNQKTELTVSSADWLYSTCIYYRLNYLAATELRCYNLDQWIALPSDLLKQQFSNQLSSKHRLLIEVQQFEQQFDTPKLAKVLLSLRVSAYHISSDKLISSKSIQLSLATEPNAKGAVSGLAQLTAQASSAIQLWLNTL